MEIAPNDLEYLAKAISTNAAVLFLGAGFSTDAKNRLAENIPPGSVLAGELWRFLGYPGSYDGSELSSVFQAALAQGNTKQLQNFLEEKYTCEAVPEWYQFIAKIFWYRIYTTNIDTVVEQIYGAAVGSQKLHVINGVLEDFRERDQLLESIQYIKLNGTIPGPPSQVTFSFRQYAARSAQNDVWYDHFVRDYSTRTTIFIGTNLNEPLFWKAIETRGARFRDSENRPKSFLVSPYISPVRIDALREYRIVPIAAQAKDFFNALANALKTLPDRVTVLRQTNPDFEALVPLLNTQISAASRRHIQQFYAHFHVVRIPSQRPNYTKTFLQGAEPLWSDVLNDLDAHREVNSVVFDLIQKQFATSKTGTVIVTGPAGTGKSTLLKRVALDLVSQSRSVFFSDCTDLPALHDFEGALDLLPSRSIIIFDNAGLAFANLLNYLEAAHRAEQKHTFVVAERTNKLDEALAEIKETGNVSEVEMPNLSQADIESVIDTLTKHHMLGRLANRGRGDQRQVFSGYARNQILVAMRRATLGDKFDETIKNEFLQVQPLEAKMLYLCGCLATAAQFSLSKQQLLASSTARPAEALSYIARNLKNVLIPTSSNSDYYVARHRVIAELIVGKLVLRSMLKEAYIRLLQTLANDVSFTNFQMSATFRLYRKLINHTSIYKRFASDLAEARSIYDAIQPFVTRDFHFWLQYGSLELEYGELDTAANYLEQAYAYKPDDSLVMTTRALLFYKQSIAVSCLEEASALKDKARSIISQQMESRPKDHYPAHVYCTKELAWINHWLPYTSEKKHALEDLREFAQKAAKAHPTSKDMQNAYKLINDCYLDLAAKPIKYAEQR
jgi:hypothetical protein